MSPAIAPPRAPFEITPEQEEIQRDCRDFAAREIRPISVAVDEADPELPREIWDKAAEIGLSSFILPEEYGGGGMTDCLTGCIVHDGGASLHRGDDPARRGHRLAAQARPPTRARYERMTETAPLPGTSGRRPSRSGSSTRAAPPTC
jgi:hypothetical protein